MAEESKTAWGREKLFALDWRGFAAQGILADVLRLFSLRRAWLERGDQKAYAELVRSRRAADPNIRAVARLILAEMAGSDKPNDSSAPTSNVDLDGARKREP
jgi:hypothetical protein